MRLIKTILGLTSNFLVPYKKPEAQCCSDPLSVPLSHCGPVLSLAPLLLRTKKPSCRYLAGEIQDLSLSAPTSNTPNLSLLIASQLPGPAPARPTISRGELEELQKLASTGGQQVLGLVFTSIMSGMMRRKMNVWDTPQVPGTRDLFSNISETTYRCNSILLFSADTASHF